MNLNYKNITEKINEKEPLTKLEKRFKNTWETLFDGYYPQTNDTSALYRYLEYLEDLQVGLKALKSKSKTCTSEEANERLK